MYILHASSLLKHKIYSIIRLVHERHCGGGDFNGRTMVRIGRPMDNRNTNCDYRNACPIHPRRDTLHLRGDKNVRNSPIVRRSCHRGCVSCSHSAIRNIPLLRRCSGGRSHRSANGRCTPIKLTAKNTYIWLGLRTSGLNQTTNLELLRTDCRAFLMCVLKFKSSAPFSSRGSCILTTYFSPN